MEEEIEVVLDKYRKAGRILAAVREGAVAKVKEGALLLEVAEFVEQSTRDRGGDSAYTSITIKLAESELREKKVPCSWYVKRLAIFKGVNLEEEVRKKLMAS